MLISSLIVAIICAWLYRQGGAGRDYAEKVNLPAWLFNTKWRDLGIPIVCGGWALLNVDATWVQHLVAGGLLFASLTTYWDKITGKDNFYLHGLACGLAYLPYYRAWLRVSLRAVLLMIIMGQLNYWLEKKKINYRDWIEECGRGFVIGITLIML